MKWSAWLGIALILFGLITSLFIPATSAHAALTDTPTNWSNFNFVPYTYQSNTIFDMEGPHDTSNGGTAVGNNTFDIASCSPDTTVGTPGTQPSFSIAFYDVDGDPSTVNDSYVAFRIRVAGDPIESGLQRGYESGHWFVLIDIDNSGFPEFAVDLDGNVCSADVDGDRLYLLYSALQANTFPGQTEPHCNTNKDTIPLDFIIDHWYAAGPGASATALALNHTRVLTAPGSCDSGTQYFIDMQLPLSAFNVDGTQLLTTCTPARFIVTTSDSIVNPFQKDWLLSNARNPQYGDPWTGNLTATKRDSLFTDADSNGVPSPGDTLLYTVVITNTGFFSADNITYHDVITDPNLTLTDTVTTTQGTIDLGNTPGDTEAQVAIGNIAAGSSVTITFTVQISDPVPAGVTQVSNHGEVVGTCFPSFPTDDPDTVAPDDPTITPLTAAPLIEAAKTDSLFTDADSNSVPSPGDTILYTITVENNGNEDASNVKFTDTPDPNTTLIVGSVTPSQGAVTSGNSSGDTSVGVNLGTIAGNHGSATITFKVIIDSPLPANVTEICNQGIVFDTSFQSEPTDDPSTEAIDDPTCTAITAAPLITAEKHVALTDDFGNDGPGPGDTLTYTITILNNGNQNATGVTFSDTPDPNTTLIVGSVIPSGGTVITGNNPGDTFVAVDVGIVPGGGGTVTISFQVTINDPLPQGVVDICNQGSVSGSNFTLELTDNPDTIGTHDPTCLAVGANPSIHATKTDVLLIDADGNGFLSTGDTLIYFINVLNDGNTIAQNVQFADAPDPNSALVVGSVTTSQGTITSGNSAGDTTVQVNVGDIAPEVTVQITFEVTIDCGSFNQIQNQGNVTGTNFSQTLTDDPTTQPIGDPTITPAVSTECPEVVTPPILPGDPRIPKPPKPSPSLATTGLNNPTQFCIKYTRCKPRINPGQPVVISTNVVNEGDVAGTYNVVLKINGRVEQQQVVTVGPRLANPINFTVVKSEPGTYNVSIDNDRTSFTVVSQGTHQYAGPIIAIVGIIFMLLFVMVLILIRRRLEFS